MSRSSDGLVTRKRKARQRRSTPSPTVVLSSRPVASPVLDTYWRFAAARQELFTQRMRSEPPPWTDDPILQRYRFTNVYRASDRVSQYLISNVIYDRDRDFRSTFFRVVLFKIFNRIETWRTLEAAIGDLVPERYDFAVYDQILEDELSAGRRVYSAAYIMPTGARNERKHRVHLKLLESMMTNGLAGEMAECGTMCEAFEALLRYPSVGPFLAYQWLIDLNYTPHLHFDEMEYVVPGPGARDGIAKCFSDLNGWSSSDVVRWLADEQEHHFERLGLTFDRLGGRPLQLVDCQNLFCEVDKYARVMHPEIKGVSGRTRIKQTFTANPSPIEYFYPPKWGINDDLSCRNGTSHEAGLLGGAE